MEAKPSPFGDASHTTTTRDTENSRAESKEDWERVVGVRKVGVTCCWDFAEDEIVAKHDDVHGHGDTVADALEDLAERLRRRSD